SDLGNLSRSLSEAIQAYRDATPVPPALEAYAADLASQFEAAEDRVAETLLRGEQVEVELHNIARSSGRAPVLISELWDERTSIIARIDGEINHVNDLNAELVVARDSVALANRAYMADLARASSGLSRTLAAAKSVFGRIATVALVADLAWSLSDLVA